MKVIRDRPKSVEIDELFSRPLFAYLGTDSEFGPRMSPVWFLWEGEVIWIIGNRKKDSFPKRIEKEPPCAIAIVDFDCSRGLVHHVGLHGRATIEPFDKDRAKRLLRRYWGEREHLWDAKRLIRPLDDPDNVFVRFEAETVVARDQSYSPSPDVQRRQRETGGQIAKRLAFGANRETLKRIVDIFSTSDLSQVDSVISPDYVDHQGLRGSDIRGQEGFSQVVLAARKGLPNLRVVIEDIIAQGDRAVARLEWHSTTPSGEQVVRETIEILRFENGRAVEHWGGVWI